MDQKLGITGRKKLMNVREMKIGNGNTHLNKEMVTKIGIKMGGGGCCYVSSGHCNNSAWHEIMMTEIIYLYACRHCA